MRYRQRIDGEGFTVPNGQVTRWACCDCGLVHDLAFVTKAVEAVKSHEMAATYGVSAAQNDPPGKARAKRSRPNQKPAEGEG